MRATGEEFLDTVNCCLLAIVFDIYRQYKPANGAIMSMGKTLGRNTDSPLDALFLVYSQTDINKLQENLKMCKISDLLKSNSTSLKQQ